MNIQTRTLMEFAGLTQQGRDAVREDLDKRFGGAPNNPVLAGVTNSCRRI